MRASTVAISILIGCAISANDTGRLLNLSNRAYIGTGDERLIGSVRAVGEPGTQVEVLAVARGPSLADALPADYTGNVLTDPKLTLVDLATREETTNDNFADWNEGEIETRFPGFITEPKESGAIFMMDADQAYSAIVEGVDGATGLGQIEFYEIGGTGSIAEARLGNLSNRALVGIDDERLIGSAMTTGGSPMEVLVLARGPSLADVLPGYTGDVLADPRLTLVDLATREETTNDNFGNWNEGEIEIRFPGFITDPKESGFIVELPAESTYSAIVEGVGGTTGIGQIEFYELPPAQDDITAYVVDDLLPGVPTTGSFPSVKTGGEITIMDNEEGTTITLDNGGFFELTDGMRYTCRSLAGCRVVNGMVTAGPIAAARSEPPPLMTHPDLEVGTPTVDDASPATGGTFTLSATVNNSGDGESAATTLRYYRSTDATITTADTEVGTDSVGILAAAGTSDQSIDLTAPSTEGTWYYGACVDAVTGESDTTNNCSSSVTVTVEDSTPPPGMTTHPDLEVGTPTVDDANPATGGTFTLSATVNNSGDGESAATTLRYYRSTDATITTADTEVGTDSVGILAAAGTSDQSIDLTAPSTEGTWYYGACVEAVTGETDTTNNCSSSVTVTVEDSTTTTHPDLEVGTPTVDDANPATGGTFTLSATVNNSGDGESAATTLRYYRSTDATITTADTEVGTDSVGTLAAAGTSDQSIDLTAPSTAGTWYYGACVDAVTGESDSKNNCSSSVTVTVEDSTTTTHPDLEVGTPSVSDDSPAEGGSFTLSATVSNSGDGASAATTLSYYLSTDATISTSDTEVGTDSVGALAAAGTSDQSIDLTAPSTAGTYYFGACVVPVTGESDTTNNCSDSVQVTVTQSPPPAMPDLVVSKPASDMKVRPGATFTLSPTVTNIGDAESSATTLRYYSRYSGREEYGQVPNGQDTEVGTDAIGPLMPSGTSDQSIELTAPTTLGDYQGAYRYGACVDMVAGEPATTNNCSNGVEVRVQFRPDLAMSVSAPARVRPGALFKLWATITNDGDQDVTGRRLTVRYYQSTDATITTSDTDLSGGISFGSELAAGSSNTDDTGEYVRASSTPGTYYFGACVNTVPNEWSTANNCSEAVAVTVKGYPDLDVGIGHGWTTAPVTGGSFYVTVRLENEGDGESAATTLRYYQSEDDTITSSDTEVGTDDIDALAPGTIIHERLDLTAPSETGTYYFGACVDAVPEETDTSNNCTWATSVTVPAPAPNLIVGAKLSKVHSILAPGTPVTLTATVINGGSLDAAATTLRFYRSDDGQTISSSDTQLGSDVEVGALASQRGSQHSIDITAPLAPGDYDFGACVDAVAGELNTADNCSTGRWMRVTVPDLEVGTPSVNDANPATGGAFTLSTTVTNSGGRESATTTLRYYRSTDSTITTSDTEVGTDAIGALEWSDESDQSIDLTAPSTAGPYYYGACVDTVTYEYDTADNCSSSVKVVAGMYADLQVGTPSVDNASPAAGGSFTLSATVSNSGNEESAATMLRYYRSTDSTISSADTEVGTDSIGAIASGGTSDQSIGLTAPSDTGTYYYGACVDSVTDESDTTNNCSSSVQVDVD